MNYFYMTNEHLKNRNYHKMDDDTPYNNNYQTYPQVNFGSTNYSELFQDLSNNTASHNTASHNSRSAKSSLPVTKQHKNNKYKKISNHQNNTRQAPDSSFSLDNNNDRSIMHRQHYNIHKQRKKHNPSQSINNSLSHTMTPTLLSHNSNNNNQQGNYHNYYHNDHHHPHHHDDNPQQNTHEYYGKRQMFSPSGPGVLPKMEKMAYTDPSPISRNMETLQNLMPIPQHVQIQCPEEVNDIRRQVEKIFEGQMPEQQDNLFTKYAQLIQKSKNQVYAIPALDEENQLQHETVPLLDNVYQTTKESKVATDFLETNVKPRQNIGKETRLKDSRNSSNSENLDNASSSHHSEEISDDTTSDIETSTKVFFPEKKENAKIMTTKNLDKNIYDKISQGKLSQFLFSQEMYQDLRQSIKTLQNQYLDLSSEIHTIGNKLSNEFQIVLSNVTKSTEQTLIIEKNIVSRIENVEKQLHKIKTNVRQKYFFCFAKTKCTLSGIIDLFEKTQSNNGNQRFTRSSMIPCGSWIRIIDDPTLALLLDDSTKEVADVGQHSFYKTRLIDTMSGKCTEYYIKVNDIEKFADFPDSYLMMPDIIQDINSKDNSDDITLSNDNSCDQDNENYDASLSSKTSDHTDSELDDSNHNSSDKSMCQKNMNLEGELNALSSMCDEIDQTQHCMKNTCSSSEKSISYEEHENIESTSEDSFDPENSTLRQVD